MVARQRLPVSARVATPLLAALTVLALSACTGAGASDPTRSPTPSAGASGTPSATATPKATSTPNATPSGSGSTSSGSGSTPSAAAGAGATAVSMTCDQLLTPDQLYSFNPNFGDDPGYQPTAGSLAATAVADKGVACAYLNQTSGAVIQLAVAEPGSASLTALESTAAKTSTAVTTYDATQGYFSSARGEAQVFTGPYWITAVGPTEVFGAPGDPAPLIRDIEANLAAR